MAIVERMCKCHGRIYPFQTMLGQRERAKEGRSNSQGMHGGTNIVEKTR
jgi:hypothetical protein